MTSRIFFHFKEQEATHKRDVKILPCLRIGQRGRISDLLIRIEGEEWVEGSEEKGGGLSRTCVTPFRVKTHVSYSHTGLLCHHGCFQGYVPPSHTFLCQLRSRLLSSPAPLNENLYVLLTSVQACHLRCVCPFPGSDK